ncbi:MAG: hypothetical protein O2955_17410, partial [Planctomycetota bacterium]|nr:hypothetical protein [Planctomycetota bacterium]
MSFKLGELSLDLKNIAVVTGEPTEFGGLPEKPVPVPAKKLLPPNSAIWITFDYETNFEKSDQPQGSSFLAVGIEIPAGKPWGYGPADISQKAGKGTVRVSIFGGGPKVIEFNDAIKLVAYTRTNNGEDRQVTSEAGIPVKFRIDGMVTLSTTEYAELQAMKKTLADLEKRLS